MAKKSKAKKADETKALETAPGGIEAAAPRGGKKKLILIVALAAVTVTSGGVGGWFFLAGHGKAEASTEAKADAPIPFPMPAALVADASATTASDYHIISVFGGEAILATGENLIRLRVGSQAPGLGTITAIESGENGGGTITGTEATLRAG